MSAIPLHCRTCGGAACPGAPHLKGRCTWAEPHVGPNTPAAQSLKNLAHLAVLEASLASPAEQARVQRELGVGDVLKDELSSSPPPFDPGEGIDFVIRALDRAGIDAFPGRLLWQGPIRGWMFEGWRFHDRRPVCDPGAFARNVEAVSLAALAALSHRGEEP